MSPSGIGVFPAELISTGVFKCCSPWKNPTFTIRSVPTILPEGNEITRMKSKPERQSLITEEGTGLEFPGGGCLGGCFIELGEAGWGQPHSTWKGIQGRKPSSELQEKVPGSFFATSTSPNLGRIGTQSRQNRNRDQLSSCSGQNTFPITSNGY